MINQVGQYTCWDARCTVSLANSLGRSHCQR